MSDELTQREVIGLQVENDRLREELESTANKLSDCWLFLDGIGRCRHSHPTLKENAQNLLTLQEAPGWKGWKP